jgi:Ca-activated chloride channel family protein
MNYEWSNLLRRPISLLIALLSVIPGSAVFSQSISTSKTPTNIAIIFDLSNSTSALHDVLTIKPKDIETMFSPLLRSNLQNRYFVISVKTVPEIVLDGSTDGNATIKALFTLASKRREGATALNDACYLGIEKVSQDDLPNQVLLVVSDGWDTVSQRTRNELETALVAKRVKLFAIEIGDPTHRLSDGGARVLNELASISRGEAYHPQQSKDFRGIMESIVAKLK